MSDFWIWLCKRFVKSAKLRAKQKLLYDDLLANYPSSPSCKLCEQGVTYLTWICSVEAKALSSPPGKYGRKAEIISTGSLKIS